MTGWLAFAKIEQMIEKNAVKAEAGKKGGLANARKNGLKHMSEIGKKGADKRWKKLSPPPSL